VLYSIKVIVQQIRSDGARVLLICLSCMATGSLSDVCGCTSLTVMTWRSPCRVSPSWPVSFCDTRGQVCVHEESGEWKMGCSSCKKHTRASRLSQLPTLGTHRNTFKCVFNLIVRTTGRTAGVYSTDLSRLLDLHSHVLCVPVWQSSYPLAPPRKDTLPPIMMCSLLNNKLIFCTPLHIFANYVWCVCPCRKAQLLFTLNTHCPPALLVNPIVLFNFRPGTRFVLLFVRPPPPTKIGHFRNELLGKRTQILQTAQLNRARAAPI
jgi:hypothetical protein